MNYGTTYALVDFIDRLVPKVGPADGPYLKALIAGLKRVAVAQNENPWLTINATVTAGIWIYYRNSRRWLMNPGQRYLRLENALGQAQQEPDIESGLRSGILRGEIVDTGKTEFKQWRVSRGGLPLIWSFIESLDKPPQDISEVDYSHPRYFPGEVRQMALEQFQKDGRFCPGVDGITKRHKLIDGEPIEFDHVLPHSKGGPSTYRNIQVLCVACNRIKGATAS